MITAGICARAMTRAPACAVNEHRAHIEVEQLIERCQIHIQKRLRAVHARVID